MNLTAKPLIHLRLTPNPAAQSQPAEGRGITLLSALANLERNVMRVCGFVSFTECTQITCEFQSVCDELSVVGGIYENHDMGSEPEERFSIERLPDLPAPASSTDSGQPTPNNSSLPTFTTFCQERIGTGTIHITAVQALDVDAAIEAGKRQCMADWNARELAMGDPQDDPFYNMRSIHCLGVAKGNVEILDWQDICNV